MSVESRLRQATSELEAVMSQTAIPELSDSSKPRALTALVVAAAVVAVIALPLLMLDPPAPSHVAIPGDGLSLSTASSERTSIESLERTDPPRPMTGPIGSVDPTEARRRILDRIEFDPEPFGSEYRLVPIDDPESLRSWFKPVIRHRPGQWKWTVLGQVAGFDLALVMGTNDGEAVVCAGLELDLMSCVGEGFETLSVTSHSPDPPDGCIPCHLVDGEFVPAVWTVPERTAVVAFAEQDNKGWQIPSSGAVAFPRSHLSSGATLTAHDFQGRMIGQVEFHQLVSLNEPFPQLPQPTTVDLVRVLLERQLPAIADSFVIESHPAAATILGNAEAVTVRFTHVDASQSFAILVGDGVRSIAIWSLDPTTLYQPFSDDPVAEDYGDLQVADSLNGLIVTRGVEIHEIVDLWNAALDAE